MSDRQNLIRQFAVAIAGAHQTRAFRAHEVALEEIWRIATSLADREPSQPESQPEHTRVCAKKIMRSSDQKRGRPATERGAYNPHPPRQFGRISEDDWSELRAACEAAGQSMVDWALPVLLRKARRENKKDRQ